MKTSPITITLDADDQISLLKKVPPHIIQVSTGANQEIAITFQLDQWMNFDGKDKDLTRLEGADFTIDRAATGAGKKLWDVFLSKVKTTIAFDKYQAPKAAPKVPKPNH